MGTYSGLGGDYHITGISGFVNDLGHGDLASAGIFHRPDGLGHPQTHPYAIVMGGGLGTGAGQAFAIYDFTINSYTFVIDGNGVITSPFNGSIFGGANGAAATAVVTQADANIKLYNVSATNWAGIGADSGGNMWFRTGVSGSDVVPPMFLNSGNGSLTIRHSITMGQSAPILMHDSGGPIYFGSLGHKIERLTDTGRLWIGGGQDRVEIGNLLKTQNILVPGANGFTLGRGLGFAYGLTNVAGIGLLEDCSFFEGTGNTNNTVMHVHRNGANGPVIVFDHAATICGSINVANAASTSYLTASDGRRKEDLKSFDAGKIIDDTKVYDFKWKGLDVRSFGVIAQEANDVFPNGVDYNEFEDWWGVDYSKYVPVILQELKALRARVAELEGLQPK
jgi:Chaperone of endosialidase